MRHHELLVPPEDESVVAQSVHAIRVPGKGTFMVCGENTGRISVFQKVQGRIIFLRAFTLYGQLGYSDVVPAVTCLRCGPTPEREEQEPLLAVGLADGRVVIVRIELTPSLGLADCKVRSHHARHDESITALRWSRDGTRLFSGCSGGKIVVVMLHPRNRMFELVSGGIYGADIEVLETEGSPIQQLDWGVTTDCSVPGARSRTCSVLLVVSLRRSLVMYFSWVPHQDSKGSWVVSSAGARPVYVSAVDHIELPQVAEGAMEQRGFGGCLWGPVSLDTEVHGADQQSCFTVTKAFVSQPGANIWCMCLSDGQVESVHRFRRDQSIAVDEGVIEDEEESEEVVAAAPAGALGRLQSFIPGGPLVCWGRRDSAGKSEVSLLNPFSNAIMSSYAELEGDDVQSVCPLGESDEIDTEPQFEAYVLHGKGRVSRLIVPLHELSGSADEDHLSVSGDLSPKHSHGWGDGLSPVRNKSPKEEHTDFQQESVDEGEQKSSLGEDTLQQQQESHTARVSTVTETAAAASSSTDTGGQSLSIQTASEPKTRSSRSTEGGPGPKPMHGLFANLAKSMQAFIPGKGRDLSDDDEIGGMDADDEPDIQSPDARELNIALGEGAYVDQLHEEWWDTTWEEEYWKVDGAEWKSAFSVHSATPGSRRRRKKLADVSTAFLAKDVADIITSDQYTVRLETSAELGLQLDTVGIDGERGGGRPKVFPSSEGMCEVRVKGFTRTDRGRGAAERCGSITVDDVLIGGDGMKFSFVDHTTFRTTSEVNRLKMLPGPHEFRFTYGSEVLGMWEKTFKETVPSQVPPQRSSPPLPPPRAPIRRKPQSVHEQNSAWVIPRPGKGSGKRWGEPSSDPVDCMGPDVAASIMGERLHAIATDVMIVHTLVADAAESRFYHGRGCSLLLAPSLIPVLPFSDVPLAVSSGTVPATVPDLSACRKLIEKELTRSKDELLVQKRRSQTSDNKSRVSISAPASTLRAVLGLASPNNTGVVRHYWQEEIVRMESAPDGEIDTLIGYDGDEVDLGMVSEVESEQDTLELESIEFMDAARDSQSALWVFEQGGGIIETETRKKGWPSLSQTQAVVVVLVCYHAHGTLAPQALPALTTWMQSFKPKRLDERGHIWQGVRNSEKKNVVLRRMACGLLTMILQMRTAWPYLQLKRSKQAMRSAHAVEGCRLEISESARADADLYLPFDFLWDRQADFDSEEDLALAHDCGQISPEEWSEKEACDFVNDYGAYLCADSAVAAACAANNEVLLEQILKISMQDSVVVAWEEQLLEMTAKKGPTADVQKKVQLFLDPEATANIRRPVLCLLLHNLFDVFQWDYVTAASIAASHFPNVRPDRLWLTLYEAPEVVHDKANGKKWADCAFQAYLQALLENSKSAACWMDEKVVQTCCQLSLHCQRFDIVELISSRMLKSPELCASDSSWLLKILCQNNHWPLALKMSSSVALSRCTSDSRNGENIVSLVCSAIDAAFLSSSWQLLSMAFGTLWRIENTLPPKAGGTLFPTAIAQLLSKVKDASSSRKLLNAFLSGVGAGTATRSIQATSVSAESLFLFSDICGIATQRASLCRRMLRALVVASCKT